MTTDLNKIFHFHLARGAIDVEAASYSEARRKFFKATGHFPDPDTEVEVSD